MSRKTPPVVCPRCGAVDGYRPRYATGGGWRIVAYVCDECGRRVRPERDQRDRAGGA